jgi:hypothetical protein
VSNIFLSASKVIFYALLVLKFHGCSDTQFSDSPIPSLEIIEAVSLPHPVLSRDSIINLRFSYSDGDGDLGIKDSDTLAANDFTIRFFEIKNGIETPFLIPLTEDTLNFNQRFPYLTPSGRNKSIKGEILIEIPINPYPGYNPVTVIFKSILTDRAGNKSNEVVTPAIKITH